MDNSNPSGVFLGPIQLLDRAWMIFEKKWKSMLAVFLPILVVIASFIVLVALSGIGLGVLRNVPGALFGGVLVLLFMIAFIIILIALSFWAQLALLYIIVNHTRTVGIKEAYFSSKKYISPYLWATLLTVLITLPGYVAFIIPGIVLSVWFIFFQYIIIDQKVRGLEALLVSREYVRGRWWGVLGRIAVMILIMLVFSALSELLVNVSGQVRSNFLIIFVFLVSNIVQIAVSFLFSIYMYVMYENLREIKGVSIPIAPSTRTKFTVLGYAGLVLVILLPILFMLVIAAMPSELLQVARSKAKQAEIQVVRDELAVYRTSNGTFPPELNELNDLEGKLVLSGYSYSLFSEGSDYLLCTKVESVTADEAKNDSDTLSCYNSQGEVDSSSFIQSDSEEQNLIDDNESATDSMDPSRIMLEGSEMPDLSEEELMRY